RSGTCYVHTFVTQRLRFRRLVAPVFTACAIAEEKARGTLPFLLATNLTATEIILGKCLARVAQMSLLVFTGLPTICFMGILGGLDAMTLLTLTVVTLGPLFALGAASLLVSVWCK